MKIFIRTKYQVPGGPPPGTYLTTAGIVLVCAGAVVLIGMVAGVVLR